MLTYSHVWISGSYFLQKGSVVVFIQMYIRIMQFGMISCLSSWFTVVSSGGTLARLAVCLVAPRTCPCLFSALAGCGPQRKSGEELLRRENRDSVNLVTKMWMSCWMTVAVEDRFLLNNFGMAIYLPILTIPVSSLLCVGSSCPPTSSHLSCTEKIGSWFSRISST